MARSANMISRGSIALAEKAGSSHFSSERCAPLWGYNVQEMNYSQKEAAAVKETMQPCHCSICTQPESRQSSATFMHTEFGNITSIRTPPCICGVTVPPLLLFWIPHSIGHISIQSYRERWNSTIGRIQSKWSKELGVSPWLASLDTEYLLPDRKTQTPSISSLNSRSRRSLLENTLGRHNGAVRSFVLEHYRNSRDLGYSIYHLCAAAHIGPNTFQGPSGCGWCLRSGRLVWLPGLPGTNHLGSGSLEELSTSTLLQLIAFAESYNGLYYEHNILPPSVLKTDIKVRSPSRSIEGSCSLTALGIIKYS